MDDNEFEREDILDSILSKSVGKTISKIYCQQEYAGIKFRSTMAIQVEFADGTHLEIYATTNGDIAVEWLGQEQ